MLTDMVRVANTSPPLCKADATFVREVIGVFSYYTRAVDPTQFTQLNKLAPRQAVPTEALLADTMHFLQYAAT
jgi:hypothetical protein